MGAIDERERSIADGQFGSGSPTTWYAAISTTIPNGDGTSFTEPAGGSYARVAITNNVTNFPAATTVGGRTVKRNATKWTWPDPTGNWGGWKAVGLFTTASGGLPQFWKLLDEERDVRSGNTPVEIDVAQVELEFSGG